MEQVTGEWRKPSDD